MTHEQKINYIRIAAGICCFSFKNEHLDLLVSLYEGIIAKEGKFTVDDAATIEYEVKERAIQNASKERQAPDGTDK